MAGGGGSREAVASALIQASDVSETLAELPTVGVVWRNNSGVGRSIKYAHRTTEPDGAQYVTFVTDEALDTASFYPWEVADGPPAKRLDYTVIELRLDASGNGVGTMSYAAEVEVDPESGLVSLNPTEGMPQVLTGAQLLPRPYWAQ